MEIYIHCQKFYLNRSNLTISFWIQTQSLRLLIISFASYNLEVCYVFFLLLLFKSLIEHAEPDWAPHDSVRDHPLRCQPTNQHPSGSFTHLAALNPLIVLSLSLYFSILSTAISREAWLHALLKSTHIMSRAAGFSLHPLSLSEEMKQIWLFFKHAMHFDDCRALLLFCSLSKSSIPPQLPAYSQCSDITSSL